MSGQGDAEANVHHNPVEGTLRFLRSLNYSVGIKHQDYVAAFRCVFGSEAKVVSA